MRLIKINWRSAKNDGCNCLAIRLLRLVLTIFLLIRQRQISQNRTAMKRELKWVLIPWCDWRPLQIHHKIPGCKQGRRRPSRSLGDKRSMALRIRITWARTVAVSMGIQKDNDSDPTSCSYSFIKPGKELHHEVDHAAREVIEKAGTESTSTTVSRSLISGGCHVPFYHGNILGHRRRHVFLCWTWGIYYP